MNLRIAVWIFPAAALLSCCGAPATPRPAPKLTVAAAANLTNVFGEIGRAFQAKTGIDTVFSYGATAQLAQQIENGAPFDVFAAADTEHVDSLVAAGRLAAGSRAVYATGQLALWIPKDTSSVRQLSDLKRAQVRFIAVAQPELAPYGQAAVDALKNAHLWEAVKPKLVYANSISMARQLAASENADAAFTAYSLVLHDAGTVLKVDPGLYHPIQQAMGIVAASGRLGEAGQFKSFLLGPEGQAILAKAGYVVP